MGIFGKAKPPPPPIIDPAYLARLRRQVGDVVLNELISDGAIEIVDRIELIRQCVEADRRDKAAALCHDLIAVSGQFGLSAMSRAAADLNRGAREPGKAPLRTIAAPLLALRDVSIDALRRAARNGVQETPDPE